MIFVVYKKYTGLTAREVALGYSKTFEGAVSVLKELESPVRRVRDRRYYSVHIEALDVFPEAPDE